MARKNKRSQVRKPQRGQPSPSRAARPAGMPPAAEPGNEVAPAPAAPSQAPTPAVAPRMVQRPLPRSRGRQAGPLPSEDATIPLDRVPYFSSDIRRIALTAALMVVLLIVGSIVLRGMLQA